jgi:hypothetical protein
MPDSNSFFLSSNSQQNLDVSLRLPYYQFCQIDRLEKQALALFCFGFLLIRGCDQRRQR